MKKLLLMLFALLWGISTFAQILQPAKWNYEVSRKEVKAGETVDLVFTATIAKDWYLYSNDFDPNLGPMVTTFTFTPNDSYQPVGKVQPVKPKKKYDDIWEGEYTYFTGKGEFRQTVKVLKANPKITGSIEYQVCSEIDGKCIPNTEEFTFADIKVVAQGATSPEPSGSSQNAHAVAPSPIDSASAGTAGASAQTDSGSKTRPAAVAPTPTNATETDESLLGFALLAFFSGFAALLMPCVYPLIPMTVSFFINQGGSRKKGVFNAFVYGISIILIYTLIGSIFSLIFGSDGPNAISTHWLPNLFFFAMLVVFGLSFLGLFEIILPSWIVNRVDRESDKGGLYGIFFMAFTLALVSFSCTGPIAGSLLIAASQGVSTKSIVGMVSYSMAFALPFTLFAIFPSWLKNLPKSGGWLNSVKVVFGFLELALALKFLSNADQVYHWGLLDRDVYLALWIVLFAMIGFYLLGKVRFLGDEKLEAVSVPRMMLAILNFAFVVYLVPGLFGAPLKPLAGLLPPQTSQDFDLTQNAGGLYANQSTIQYPASRKYADRFKMPHGLTAFYDLKEGLAYAQKVNKPVLIDFTGHGCVNCREMEARVWSDPDVLQRLKNDYVLVSLYVDDKLELPQSEWYTSSFDNRVKKTLGAQNFDYQVTKFNYNAQPLYVLLSPSGELLTQPKAYDLYAKNFTTFLDSGLEAYKKAGPGYVPMPVSAVSQ
jgi:thiol:disulfide interchange protein DsbD